ncbi:MAG: hypothetical protein R3195_19755 [Gemmatimonadota bacterium]|nr:hypothetical protein [Gemmatimonadota bacterium]
MTTNGGLSAFATPGWRTPGAIPLQTGSTYRASVWTYTSDGGVGHVPAIQFFRADGTFLGAIGATHPSGLTDPDGTWVYKEFDFDISAFPGLADATHVRLIVVQDIFETVGTQTSVYFDDVYFGEILPGALVVDVDAKPGSDANHINCSNGREVIPVAILTTPDFDATTVDHRTVTFAGASETHVNRRTGESRRHVEDVDRDGDPDLLLHFRYGDTSLTCDSTEGRLSGYTYEGLPVEGSDALLVSARGRAPGD